MYDTIRCYMDLPGPSGYDFQTKDLECVSADYQITADGRLLVDRAGPWAEIPEPGTVVPHEGDLKFYVTANDDTWLEYHATFKDGRCVGIEARTY